MSVTDYVRVERAIEFLDRNFRLQPSLSDVAAFVGLSESHFHRMFRRWAGVSPKRFLQFLTVDYAKAQLHAGSSVLRTTLDTGLSSASRLHDLFVTTTAVTPGQYKLHGSGLRISYGFHCTPFGNCFLAINDKGVCGLEFVAETEHDDAVRRLRSSWSAASVREDAAATGPMATRIFRPRAYSGLPLPIHVRGTNFQIKVWEALLRIPLGRMTTYHGVAEAIGRPGANRAVAAAVAENPIAYLIPCHRVIRRSGAFGEYRWGTARKKALLGWEAARPS